MNARQTLRRRTLAFAAAALVAAILTLPDLLMMHHRRFYQRQFPEAAAAWGLDGRYTSIAPLDDPDANFYAARVRAVADDGWAADAYVAGRRSARLATEDSLGFFGIGLLYKATGDMSDAWLAARALAGFFWVLALAALLLELSGNFTGSLASAVVITLFVDLLYDVLRPFSLGMGPQAQLTGFRDAVVHAWWLIGTYQYNFGPSRLLNPGWSYPPLFAALLWLSRAAKGSLRAAVAAGVVGGAVAYIHADAWHVFMAAGGTVLASLWVFERRFPWRVAVAGILALSVSLPWILHNYPVDAELLHRAGLVRGSRAFYWPGLAYLAAFAWFAALARRARLWAALALGGVFAALFVMLQSQFLTGLGLGQSGILRWNWTGMLFALIAAAGMLARGRPERRDHLWIAALAALLAAGRGVGYAAQRFPFQALPQDAERALDYLQREAPEGGVVAAIGPQENMIIPIYTRLKTLNVSGCMLSSDIPTPEIFARLRYSLSLLGIPERRLIERLQASRGGPPKWNRELWLGRADWQDREWDNFFYFYWMVLPPQEAIETLKRGVGAPVDRGPRVDYLWVGTFERSLMDARALRALGRPVFESGAVALYRAPAQ